MRNLDINGHPQRFDRSERAAMNGAGSAAEASAKLAGMGLPDDIFAAIAAAASGIPLQRDELSNKDAEAHVAARRGGVNQGPAGLQVAIEGEQVDEPAQIGPGPAALPAALKRSIFDPKTETVPAPISAPWMTIYDMPGYLSENIRALGRSVFKQFGCFRSHEEAATAAGHDSLGSIRLMANIAGSGPNTDDELNGMAAWIRDNGMHVLAEKLDFGQVIQGYTPRVILSATGEESFLMVEETRENGAPCEALYIYSWQGGRQFYIDNPNTVLELAGNVRRQLPKRKGAVKADIPMVAMPYESNMVPRADLDVRRARVAALPIGSDAHASSLNVDLRCAGFVPFGPQLTPRMRKILDDGGVAEVVGQEGVVASRSDYFDLIVYDAVGGVMSETVVRDLADVDLALDGAAMAMGY